MFGEDIGARINSMTEYEVTQCLTLDIVESFLRNLGVEQIEKGNNYLICPTICHNRLEDASSMKLYYYQKNKAFHCYTECGENMSIFTLYQNFMELNYHTITKEEAAYYVKSFVLKQAPDIHFTEKRKNNLIDKSKYELKNQIPTNTYYPSIILDRFINYLPYSWKKDGITEEAMRLFDIKFYIAANASILPHFDKDGNLIGIRCREFSKEKIEEYGKYHPLYLNGEIYSHPLSQNLYGIYQNGAAIRKYRRAVIVEGEKSVLLDKVYNQDDSFVVACCGHQIGIYQVNLLTKLFGVNEIILAFDKEYEDWRDEKGKKDRALLMKFCNKFKKEADFSYIWDYDNLLNEKDSPLDKGKDIWEYLYKNRVKVK